MTSFLKNKGKDRIYRKVFNHIVPVVPSSSLASMKDNIFEKLENKYDELTKETIDDIYDKLLEWTAENETTLLILDDVTASLKNRDVQQVLKKIIFNRRHLKVTILCLVQSYIAMPRDIRKLINNAFMFKVARLEFEALFQELFDCHKDKALDIMNFAFEKPHDFLMLNCDEQKFYKGFDQIVFLDEK